MSDPAAAERAETIVNKALISLDNNASIESVHKSLKEAEMLSPGLPSVTAAFDRLRQEESGQGLLGHCMKWLDSETDDDGEIILDYIHQHRLLAPERASESMSAILGYRGDSDMCDQITCALLKHPGAQQVLAEGLKVSPTAIYSTLFERGDDSADGITDVVLNPAAWKSEADRIAAERDIFQLALAQLMHAGEDYPDRAMKSISRLLGAEYRNLNGLIDQDGFGVILEQLDIREDQVLRSHATIATAKLIEQSPESAHSLISQYVVHRVKKPTTDGLIQSFSAAAATFPMATEPASKLFLSDGFAVNLSKMVIKRKSGRLEQAALELLSASCVVRTCREAIKKFCFDWIEEISETSPDAARAGQASVILVKINDVAAEGENPVPSHENQKTQDELVSRFKRMILLPDELGENKQDSVEGLAYSSIRPQVKEFLANDGEFLKKLVCIMSEQKTRGTSLFGGLTIFANLTTYLPVLSEEQKKISELKAYANAGRPAPPDELDDDAHVTSRCTKVLDAGVIPLFTSFTSGSNQLSSTAQTALLRILNSLSKEQKHRSKMAQQGAIKLLQEIYDRTTGASTTTSNVPTINEPSDEIAARTAAHTLSRILISVNPSHVFSSTLPVTSAIRALIKLLTDDPNAEQRNLLPTFESLLALTNIASTDDNARNTIIRLTWAEIEDLVLSENQLVQRATVELICNLCASVTGVAKFIDGTSAAKYRLHILLALTDSRDLQTRMASGGAINMIVEYEPGVEAVLNQEKGVKYLLDMCNDSDEGMKHRGLAALHCMIFSEGSTGERAMEAIKKEGAKDIVTSCLKGTRRPEILQAGVEVLKALM
ncbi:CRO1 protein [Venturia nashicola]|uniref:CRO1 protein n=1 Tax=Venturia nashicola TaxID=86259 RepID=A0A4Z1PHK6_9PEZI|nr:CRO1 protein [Venturia nashicola]TLD34742.1 CRO1 protein [Venturia nashicola]